MASFGKNKLQGLISNNFIKLIDKNYMITSLAFEKASEGIAIESEGKLILVNQAFTRLLKFQNPEDLLGNKLSGFVNENDKDRFKNFAASLNTNAGSGASDEFKFQCKDKSEIYINLCISKFELEDNNYVVYHCKDITKFKHNISQLQASEEYNRSIIENVDAAFINFEKVNNHLKLTFISPQIEKITGYHRDKFLNYPKLLLKIIHPDDLKAVKKKLTIYFKDSARFSEEVNCRIISSSENVIWVRINISVNRDPDGKVKKMFIFFSDITHSKKGESEVIKTLQKLRESNSTKDKFISIISHDLRTPFSSILGFTDILLNDKDITLEQHDQYINFIQESSQNILSLVNSLLDWTRIQTGRIKFEPERLNAREIIDKAITIMTGTAIQKEINLTSQVTKDLFIHADFNLILQVFNNLISNSIKFTKRLGNITVLAQASDEMNQAEFIIRDDGIGIKKENLDKLFKVDAKFTLEGTAGEKGSGLGLSLVHEIVIKHGGKIWVESVHGKGTDIHFTIPIAASSILLVDDSKTDRLLYSKILKNFIPQYRIEEASNGKEAFEFILNSLPALIITDHKMPEMSGYDLVKQIQMSDLKGKPPIIVLSVDVNPNIIEEYKDLNIEYVFQKPVNLVTLKDAVDKSLKKAIFN